MDVDSDRTKYNCETRLRLQSASLRRKMNRKNFRNMKKALKPFFEGRNLYRAVVTNNVEEVKRLLENGASPDFMGPHSHRQSMVHLAVAGRFTELVQILLHYGADPNRQDIIGNTPLHLAACTNNFDIVVSLLEGGADLSATDKAGRNPLEIAMGKLRILNKYVKDVDHILQVKEIVDYMQSHWLKSRPLDFCYERQVSDLADAFQKSFTTN